MAIAEKTGAKGKVVAVDPDKNRIAVAKSTFEHIENIEFKEGSSEGLSFYKKSSYDAVYMNYVLHWIQDKKPVIKNIYDVLKPGGRLAMQFGVCFVSSMEKAFKCLNPEENFTKVKEMIFYEDLENIESYCKEAGFVITEIDEVRCVLHHELSSFLQLTSAFYHGVFDVELIKEENLNKFKKYLDKEGRIFDEFPVGVIIATKPQFVQE